ncbi:MAG: hypothetical protein HY861_04040 [Chlamydiia bacterium]|nr:hypothetical protein [Chlamydiia bacterium]
MPNPVSPSGGHSPAGSNPNPPSNNNPPLGGKEDGSKETMTEFMKLFTPEQRKKFMNILIQNLTGEMQKASKKYIEELKKEREDIEKQS